MSKELCPQCNAWAALRTIYGCEDPCHDRAEIAALRAQVEGLEADVKLLQGVADVETARFRAAVEIGVGFKDRAEAAERERSEAQSALTAAEERVRELEGRIRDYLGAWELDAQYHNLRTLTCLQRERYELRKALRDTACQPHPEDKERECVHCSWGVSQGVRYVHKFCGREDCASKGFTVEGPCSTCEGSGFVNAIQPPLSSTCLPVIGCRLEPCPDCKGGAG